jgi:hypothetical protein
MVVSASVYDESGNPVSGASVGGYVQFSVTGHSLTFPPTGEDGFTSVSFNSGSPRGGYSVAFSVHAEQGGNAADTTTSCYAP